MKKLFTIFLFFISISAFTQVKKVVTVGVFNYYPAVFKDTDGEIKGFYIDALQELGEKENISFTYIFGTWNEGLDRIKSGEVNMLTSVAITEDRKQFMDYSSEPILTVWSEVYVKSKTPIHGILDLQGKTVAIMKGDFNAVYIKEYTQKFNVNCTFREVADFAEVFTLVSEGKVHAGVVNNTFGASKSLEYELISTGIVFNPFDIYFTTKKGANPELLDLLSSYLKQWKHNPNSIYNTARQKWTHGNVGTIEVFPKWLLWIVLTIFCIALLLIAFVFILRHSVKKAKAKITENEQTFKKLFDDSADAILLIDKSGNFVECNRAALKLLHLSQYEFLRNTPASISPEFQPNGEKSSKLADKLILDAFSSGLQRFDWTHINSKGEEFIVDVSLMPIVTKGEIMLHVTWRDITLRKKNELELIEAKEKAEESDRLKTKFLQNISHEIRTPMNAIMGFSSLMPEFTSNKPKLKEFSQIISQRCNDLLGIIDDLLDISKIESGNSIVHLEQCNIHNLFTELEEKFITYREKHLKQKIDLFFIKSLSDSEVTITTDTVKLKQVISNLVHNALKFTENGSVTCGYSIKYNKLLFYVSDTGIGIPKEKQEFIFDRFAQINHPTLANIGGTGLGLSIVKGLVELMGGKVWVESEYEKGSNFYFTIDYSPIAKTNNPSLSALEKQTQNNDKTILIVEDDYYNAEFLKAVILNVTSNIIETTNGISAISIAQEQRIDLILMDVRLPDITGYEATQKILAYNPDTKIIAQTAYASSSEYQKALDYGCVDYISKPTNPEKLIELVLKHLG